MLNLLMEVLKHAVCTKLICFTLLNSSTFFILFIIRLRLCSTATIEVSVNELLL